MKKFLVLLLAMFLPFLLCSCNMKQNGQINIKHESKLGSLKGVSYSTARNGRITLDMSEGPSVNYTKVNLGPRDVDFDFKSLK
ncbi:hypothetical protein IJI31_02635 [bacterium]|nr:hypothetical protein [bacterium]